MNYPLFHGNIVGTKYGIVPGKLILGRPFCFRGSMMWELPFVLGE